MANQELIDYIMRQRNNGANSANIKEALLKAGWDAKDVEEGILATEPKPVAPTPVAAPSVLAQSPIAAAPVQAMPTVAPVIEQAQPTVTPPFTQPTAAAPLGASVVQPAATPAAAPAAMPAYQPPVMSVPSAAAPEANPIAPPAQPAPIGAMPSAAPHGVQIPSSNFMPKVEVAHTAPIVPPVTTVMPAMATAAPAVEKKSHVGLIVTLIIILLVLLGGGGFAYWKFVMNAPQPVIPADQPVVQDVIVRPEASSTESTTTPIEEAPADVGPVGYPSSIPVATTTEATTTVATATPATTPASAPISPKKSATSTSVLPQGAL